MIAGILLWLSYRAWKSGDPDHARTLGSIGMGLALVGVLLMLSGAWCWSSATSDARGARAVAEDAREAVTLSCGADDARCARADIAYRDALVMQASAEGFASRSVGVVVLGGIL